MHCLSEKSPFPSAFRRGARGTIDIIADILCICLTPRGKTTIMQQANLSHQMLKFYLWHLMQVGLIQQSAELKFISTPKGEEFISHYRSIAVLAAGLATDERERLGRTRV